MPAMAVESGPAAGRHRGGAGRPAARPRPTCSRSTWAAPPPRPASSSAGEINDDRRSTRSAAAATRGAGSHGTGHPIRVPVIDLAEVSAGGGSIAWIDPGGALRVGPRERRRRARARLLRAGRHPADGHRRRPRARLPRIPWRCSAARCPCDLDRARERRSSRAVARAARARRARGGGAASSTWSTPAWPRALRIVSVERGHDPREFALVAFGGAGPVHAARLAEELEIPRRDRAAHPRRLLGARPRRHRRPPRLRAHASTRRSTRASLPAMSPRATRAMEAEARGDADARRRAARRAGRSRARPTAATAARPTS